MPPKFRSGQRVMTMVADIPSIPGTIIGGPVFRNGHAVFKVHHEDDGEGSGPLDNWYATDRMRPAISLI